MVANSNVSTFKEGFSLKWDLKTSSLFNIQNRWPIGKHKNTENICNENKLNKQ